MSYVGNTNTTQGFIPTIDYFSGNGSTTAFTLSRPVASVAQVQANISNVPQNPGSAYTVSGNTITFTSAPPSGTNNIYVYYTSPITQVIAPGQGTVNTTSLGNITNIASGNSSLTLQTGATPTTAMTIDTSQNVGIGVTPSAWQSTRKAIQTQGGTVFTGTDTATIGLIQNGYNDGTGWKYVNNGFASRNYQNSSQHIWDVAASGTAGNAITFTQAMTLDASGNLGIGTISPGAKLDVRGGIATGYSSGQGVYYYNSDGTNSYEIYNVGATGSGNPVLSFYQIGTGERMRIDSSGNLLVGTTSSFDSGAICADGGNNSKEPIACRVTQTTNSNQISFRNGNGVVGAITTNGSATAYGTSSDYRLKENIAPMTGALAKVAQLNPVTYNWKVDGEASEGFIAHELQTVVPQCVTGDKDAVDAEGNPVYQGIDTSFLVATLTAAIKEQQALIQTLTDRITALENK